jgi:hypothetical protein
MKNPLELLIVATKPPWPPTDGGRVVVLETIDALAAAGHRVTLVAPCGPDDDAEAARRGLGDRCRAEIVPARPRPARSLLVSSFLKRRPVTVVRHELDPVRRRVAELVTDGAFDLVQAEQVQAIPQTAAAVDRGIPLVYRAHNVESTLWTYAAGFGRPLTAALLRREARRLIAWERRAVRRAAATVVLTDFDLDPLRRVAGDGPLIVKVPVPFPGELPTGDGSLTGRPAIVTLASGSWLPSRETARRLAEAWWPEVRERLPEAVLHVFGGEIPDGEGVCGHPAPADSSETFVAGAIVAIPARHPTGIPIKGLEAWARGVPVVASSETATALETVDGDGLLVADGPEALARVLAGLVDDATLRRRLVEGGRRLLADRHDPARVADQLVELYRSLA